MPEDMCGILAIAASGRDRPSVDERVARRMRDRLAHRGPDGSGLWDGGPAILGHRRLAIVDRAGGSQPWVEPELPPAPGRPADGPCVLVYNGELYGADDLRRELPGGWRSRCDTEIVARVLQHRGAAGLADLRGMYALAAWWPQTRVLLLARDPLGVKPLLWSVIDAPGGPEVVAASEAAAILDHPHGRCEPDWGTVSAYLTTIRLNLDDRTLYAGIRTVRPGERIRFDLSGPSPKRLHGLDHRVAAIWPDADPAVTAAAPDDESIAATIRESVHAHLASDVPVGAMLSGGLDSTIIAGEVRAAGRALRTWCATGAPDDPDGDAAHADAVSERLGTGHETVILGREDFAERWPWLVTQLGLPLGTPNEVAIHAVASAARPHAPVLLSGEGADELFLGYGHAADAILRRSEERTPGAPATSAAAVLLAATAWIPPELKDRVLAPAPLAAARHDEDLIDDLRRETAVAGARPDDPRPLLSTLGRRNLAGLLGRLDTATMLASVEGRVPFADPVVALAAAQLPRHRMLRRVSRATVAAGAPATIDADRGLETKRVLRDAFAASVPARVRRRPKAAFPLPLAEWVGDGAFILRESATARAIFQPDAVDAVTADPAGHVLAAWPMINLAWWLRRWD